MLTSNTTTRCFLEFEFDKKEREFDEKLMKRKFISLEDDLCNPHCFKLERNIYIYIYMKTC